MNWMSKKAIIEGVSTQTKSQNIILEREQNNPMVRSMQAPMWKWHEYVVYFIFFGFLGRIIYMIVKGIKFPLPLFAEKQTLNELLQGITYIIFYLFIGVSIVTGAYLKWGDGTYKEPMETVHKWAIYWFPIFMTLHFGGIVLGELTKKKGIVSKMIGGN